MSETSSKAGRGEPHGSRRASALFDEAFMGRLAYLDIVARKSFRSQSRGERRSRKLGAGVEFADHRRYSPGDDFRNIDWNVYARLGKLLLRLYEEEEDLYVYLLVDASASMGAHAGGRRGGGRRGGGRRGGGQGIVKFDYARRVAAALAYVSLSSLDRVSIVPFSSGLGADTTPPMPPARGKAQIFRIFDFLTKLEAGGVTSMTEAFKGFVHRTKRRGLAIVISDFYSQDGWDEGLNYLRYNGFEPFVLQLVDEGELNPELRGDLTLVDCETGARRELTLTPRLLARYRAAHAKWCQGLETFCTQRQLSYFRTAIQTPFDELMLAIIARGGRRGGLLV